MYGLCSNTRSSNTAVEVDRVQRVSGQEPLDRLSPSLDAVQLGLGAKQHLIRDAADDTNAFGSDHFDVERAPGH